MEYPGERKGGFALGGRRTQVARARADDAGPAGGIPRQAVEPPDAQDGPTSARRDGQRDGPPEAPGGPWRRSPGDSGDLTGPTGKARRTGRQATAEETGKIRGTSAPV